MLARGFYKFRPWFWDGHGCGETTRVEREIDRMFTKEFKCTVCDKPENQCTCNRYCALCHADYELRLTEDGQYYCRDCREACDYKSQDQV